MGDTTPRLLLSSPRLPTPSKRGSALGFHMIGGSASYFLAPLLAGTFAAAWGWRMPFVALALPSVAFGVVFFVILGRRDRAGRSSQASAAPRAVTAAPADDVKMDWVHMAVFLTLTSVGAATVMSVVSFIPLYLVDVHGYAEGNAAFGVALYYSTGLWAAVAGGYLSDRIGRVRVVVLFALLAGPAVALLDLSGSAVAVMVLLFCLGVGMYARAPASESYVVGHTPAGKRSTVLGLYYFGALEGSGVLAPVLGLLIDHYGFRTAFVLSGGGLFDGRCGLRSYPVAGTSRRLMFSERWTTIATHGSGRGYCTDTASRRRCSPDWLNCGRVVE